MLRCDGTRDGHLLDLELDVDGGVLIWFGGAGLQTHAAFQAGELLRVDLPNVPRQHLPGGGRGERGPLGRTGADGVGTGLQYLGDRVEGVGALRGVEVGVQDPAGQLAADQHRLHRLAHGLLGAQRQVEAALGTALAERDVVLDVHGDGHQAGGGWNKEGISQV